MEFQDKSLNCVDCGAEFIWTAGEQLFFADKNFKNEPKRCKSCKAKRAARPSAGGGDRPRTRRNDDQLLGVRQGNDRAVPADAGTPGVLPRMFPVAEVRRRGRRLVPPSRRRQSKATRRAWPLSLPDGSRAARVTSERLTDRIPSQRLHPHASTSFLQRVLRLSHCARPSLTRSGAARGAARRRARRPAAAAARRRASRSSRSQHEADRAGVGIHRDRAIAALDDDPAAGRRAVTQIFVKSGDRVRAGAPLVQIDPEQAGRDGAQHRGAARRRARPTSRTGRQQVERLRVAARRPARSARRSSTGAAQPRHAREANLAALDAQVREEQVQLQYYRVTAPTAGIVGDIAVRDGDRVTTSTVITTIDDNAGSRPTSRCRSIARPTCASGCRCRSSTPTARSSPPTRSRSSRRASTTRRRRCW